MPEIINVAKQKLEAGELAIGVGLRMTRVVEVGKMMKTAGYDWLFIDMEHNSMSIDDAAQISGRGAKRGDHAHRPGPWLPALSCEPSPRYGRAGHCRAACRRHPNGQEYG